MDKPSILTSSKNVTNIMELEKSITTSELDRKSLNTAQSKLSGKMKQVINASLVQSKEIAMQSETGKLYSILTETIMHILPNGMPLPTCLNYQALRD
jgi:hypothetical protein